MKKIMFNDKYGLTYAVLKSTKTQTQTRRIIKPQPVYDANVGMIWKGLMSGRGVSDLEEPQASYRNFVHNSKYKVGEIVAVAQSYNQVIRSSDEKKQKEVYDYLHKYGFAGLDNKMFVKPELMPHHIRIINVRVQKLQDITDEECMLEGIREVEVSNNWGNSATHTEYIITYYNAKGLVKQLRARTPREAYALLIDKISGKGTWDSNPYVFVYDFELVK